MLPFLGAAVAVLVFEAAAILLSAGLCVQHLKLKRRGGKRYKGDLGYGNGYPGRARGNGVSTTGVIFASGGIGDGDNGYRCDGGDFGPDAGTNSGGGTDGGDDGGDGGGDGGGCGGGCGGD